MLTQQEDTKIQNKGEKKQKKMARQTRRKAKKKVRKKEDPRRKERKLNEQIYELKQAEIGVWVNQNREVGGNDQGEKMGGITPWSKEEHNIEKNGEETESYKIVVGRKKMIHFELS